MGAKKGSNNALKHQLKLVAGNKAKIERALFELEPIKNKFDGLKDLIPVIVTKTGINRTTLTRKGSKHKTLLLDFLNQQPGSAGTLSIEDMNEDTLRIHALAMQIEVDELKSDNKRLINKLKSVANDVHSNKSGTKTSDFMDTAMALMLIVDRFNDFIIIDPSTNSIEDLTKYEDDPDRVIANGNRTKPLFKLLKAEEELFGIAWSSDNEE